MLLTNICTRRSLIIGIAFAVIVSGTISITISILALGATFFYLTERALVALCIASAGKLTIGIQRTKSVYTGLTLTGQCFCLIAQKSSVGWGTRTLISKRPLFNTLSIVHAVDLAAWIEDGFTVFAQSPIRTTTLVIWIEQKCGKISYWIETSSQKKFLIMKITVVANWYTDATS